MAVPLDPLGSDPESSDPESLRRDLEALEKNLESAVKLEQFDRAKVNEGKLLFADR